MAKYGKWGMKKIEKWLIMGQDHYVGHGSERFVL